MNKQFRLPTFESRLPTTLPRVPNWEPRFSTTPARVPNWEPTPPPTPWFTGYLDNDPGKGHQQHLYNTPPPVYQPLPTAFEITANPNHLLNQIPDMDFAVADFNSVPMATAPFRDVPSMLLAHINRPNVFGAEPHWGRLLSYFVSWKAHYGSNNLQDLYMFITRVVLPNVIIMNRRLMLRMYTARHFLPKFCRLRYDAQAQTSPRSSITITSYMPAALGAPGKASLEPKTRPIFRSRPTPNGDDFLVWLTTLPVPLRVKSQMAHTKSDLDVYLTDDEAAVRQMTSIDLMRRASKVLSLWWSVTHRTVILMRYEGLGWAGVEREF